MRKEKYNYHMHQHSCYLLKYVLVIPIKTQLSKNTEALIYTYTKKYFEDRKVLLKNFKFENKYLILNFEGTPIFEITKFINAYKSATSRFINKGIKLSFWDTSYLLLTEDETNKKIINEYINNTF